MDYEIVELPQFSGNQAKIYSIIPKGEAKCLFDKFVLGHKDDFNEEVKNILGRIKVIGMVTGAREGFFKHEGDNEYVKKYGKTIWALFDDDDKKLRLYCIKFGSIAIIIGGGGYKDKSVIKWQDDETLSREVNLTMSYAKDILDRLHKGDDLSWSPDKTGFEGNLKNYEDE